MGLEAVVEGWFDEYEQRKSSSMLFKLVSSSIKLVSGQSGSEAAWQQLLDATGSLMTQKPNRLILEYLQWRLPLLQKVLIYPELKPDFVVEELEVMLYAAGWLPRIVKGEKVYVDDEQIKLLSLASAKVGGAEKDEREDTRFYRLVMRVFQRNFRDVRNRAGIARPGWNELVAQVLKFPPLQHTNFTQYLAEEEPEVERRFDEVTVSGLRQYMKGVRAVQTPSGQVRIEPLRNLNLLGRAEIERGDDASLRSLLRSTRNAEKKGGPTWGDYLDHVGVLDDVVDFHYGIAVNRNIIAGHPTERDDYNYAKSVVLGIIPVTYRGKKKQVLEAEDLCMLIGFRKDFRNSDKCAEELLPVFRRAQSRYEGERGKPPTQFLNAVLADKEVAAKYGTKHGSMTTQDIYFIWAAHHLKEFLRPRVTGELPFSYGNEEVLIMPGENLHVLRPESKFCDPRISRFNKQMRWYKVTIGTGYWDIVEEVLAEPAAVSYHGRAMKRQDISPGPAAVAAVTSAHQSRPQPIS